MKQSQKIAISTATLMLLLSTSSYADVVTIEKQNTGFSIDGFNGAQRGKQMILWPTNLNNRNQQWIETNLSQGHVSYRKQNTALCLDGGEGAQNRQAVTLETCDVNNEDQHWAKVNAPNGSFRLEKRDTNFSIDGNRGAQNGQRIYLWRSDSSNVNQQWDFLGEGGSTSVSANPVVEEPVVQEPVVEQETDQESNIKPNANVFSLTELRREIQRSNLTIVMQAGNYDLTELSGNSRNLLFSGSNNTIDLVGVNINIPVGSTDDEDSYITMDGSNNTILGGVFEDTYVNGLEEITDYVAYNDDRSTLASGIRGNAVMSINGQNNIIDGIKMTVRGSYPYGYGSIFGIGRDNSIGRLDKRCGILIRSTGNTITNAELQMRSFCHGIYMQDDADNTTITNTLVEGRSRSTNDMLADGPGSLLSDRNNLDFRGDRVQRDEVESLSEDGIRAYGRTGSVTVENSTVKNMRGGVRLYLSSNATVRNTVSIDNGLSNFNLSNNATVTGASGNFTNGPLLDYGLVRSRQDIEMTIIPSPNAVGRHNIADVFGDDHEIVFHRTDGPIDSQEQRVIYVTGDNSTIRNETEYRIVLENGTRGNTVISAGEVTDNGNNNVSSIPLDL